MKSELGNRTPNGFPLLEVISAAHVWLGSVGRKSRSSRSGATLTPGSLTVVRRRLRATTPEIPAARMSRSTRFRPTRTPCSRRSSAWILLEPWVPSEAAWICLIRSVSHENDGLNWPHCDVLNWPHLRPS